MNILYILAAIVIVVVSLLTKAPDQEVVTGYEDAMASLNADE